MAVSPLQGVGAAGQVKPAAAKETAKADFGKALTDFTAEVDNMQHEADKAVADLAAGREDNVHRVMIAMGKAEVSFKFMAEMRNRVVNAYQEIMRMPV